MSPLYVRWIVFLAYLGSVCLIGYWGYKKSTGLSEFYVADKKLGRIEMAGTFSASYASASSILGYSAFSFSHGWSMIVVYACGSAVGWIILSLMAAKLNKFEKGVTSADIFAERFYSEKMRLWFALVFLIWMTLFLIMQFMGIGYVIETFLYIPYWAGILIIGLTMILYISWGGMRSVVWSDVLQAVVMILGVLIAGSVVLNMTGGFKALGEVARTISESGKPAEFLMSFKGDLSWTFIIGTGLPLSMIVACVPYYHRMFFSAKSPKIAIGGVGISTPFLFFFYIALGLVGIGAHALIPDLTTPDKVFPIIVSKYMSPIIGTLILTCIVAGIMSSLDSVLLAVGAMCSHDIYKGFIKKNSSEKQELRVCRWSIIIIGLIGLFLSLDPPSTIMGIYNILIAVVSSTLFPPFIMGLFWKRTTKEAAFAGSIAGFVIAWAWITFGESLFGEGITTTIPAALIGVPIAFIIIFVVSLLTPKSPKSALAQFFDDERMSLKASANADVK